MPDIVEWHQLWTTCLLVFALLFQGGLLIIFLSSLDDCFNDLLWLGARLTGWRDDRHPDAEVAESQLAVLVPAWQEANILPRSLTHLLATARYENYRVFVGVYPNDRETRAAVEAVVCQDSRVVPILTPRPGPTCKSDCLNAVLQGVLAWEEANGARFKGFILQDAEDETHPEALSCFNRFLDHYDLIQLPVIPLVKRWNACVGGHYMDEFAEMHGKEVPLRALLTGIVPGAGVATAYARHVLVPPSGRPEDTFNTNTLTEDYDLSYRLAERAPQQLFLHLNGRHGQPGSTRRDLIATREIFPHQLRSAVVQKARWIVGISFQGWRDLGWRGSLMTRYFFLRDRKAIPCGYACLVSCLGLFYSLLQRLLSDLLPLWAPPPLLSETSLLWQIAAINIGFLFHRLLVRHLCAWWLYGWRQLPLLLPRYAVGVLVNFLAVCRATRLIIRYWVTGEPIGWDKTTHDFPEATTGFLVSQSSRAVPDIST